MMSPLFHFGFTALLLLILPPTQSLRLPLTFKTSKPQQTSKAAALSLLLIPSLLLSPSPSHAGFEEYAKTQKMTADPICFVTKCGKETSELTPTSVKGLKCLGQCKVRPV